MLFAFTFAGATLKMAKSANGVTVVVTGGVTLFVGIGSPVGEPPVAMFVMEPEAGAITVSVTLLTWLLVNVPKFQITLLPFVVPPLLALKNATPFGNASVTVTLLALDGPKFVTEIV